MHACLPTEFNLYNFCSKVNLAKTEIIQTSCVYHYVQRMFNTVKLLSKRNVYRSG